MFSIRFPSPCGVCGLKSLLEPIERTIQQAVSVPLRGLWFEIQKKNYQRGIDRACFRPLAGFVV